MAQGKHQYLLELYSNDGRLLGRARGATDWEPAEECVRFRAFQCGFDGTAYSAEVCIEPLWNSRLRPPYVSGFRASIQPNGSAVVSHDFPVSYWLNMAQNAGSQLVEKGVLKAGETFLYHVLAYPCDAETTEAGSSPFEVKAIAPAPALKESLLDDFLSGSTACGPILADDILVFVPREAIAQAEALKEQAGDVEVGGILIGHLHRDAAKSVVFAEVTAQIPARHAVSSSARLTFTADTFAAAKAAIALRRRDEIWLGWWHAHPVFHWTQSSSDKPTASTSLAGFFSAEDCALHRTIFPRAYSVALVVSDRQCEDGTWELSNAMFGWRNGAIEHRGFHILESGRTNEPCTVVSATGGNNEHKKGE